MLLQAESILLTLHLRPAINLTEEQFFEFCQLNRDLRIERTAEGDLLIMPPEGFETGKRNADLTIDLGVWARRDGSGLVTGSSAGFTLPNGAVRAPDAAWVRRSRLEAMTPEQRRRFIPLCPDFVIELRSPTDSLSFLQAKMQEYVDNGAQLGWLIDPDQRRAYVYRPDRQVELLENPSEISGDPVLPGFTLNLQRIWETGL